MQTQTNRPKVISSFQASMIVMGMGIIFVTILGLSGLGVHYPQAETSVTPASSSTTVATATNTATPAK